MNRPHSLIVAVLAIVLMAIPFLAGCGSTPAPTLVPTKAATSVPATQPAATKAPTAVPATATKVPPTPTAGPTVGGTLVVALAGEPDTLDIHKSASGQMNTIMSIVDGALIARDPATGGLVPYLADSWKVADDGLTIDFKLHAGVKFHDGSPLTAQDWVWTFTRAIDPETKSPSTGAFLAALDKAEAVDDMNLRLRLKAPNFPLLLNLTSNAYCGPLSKAAVEKAGDGYGRSPIGVGPFQFKQWQTGTKIVLERNPNYNWAPAFLHQGAAYLQAIEFLVVPEYSTALSGLESGDIDIYGADAGRILAKDLVLFKDKNKVGILSFTVQGMNPYIQFNCSASPFDDVKVRQALNYGTNKSVMIQAVTLGNAVPQHAPLSPSQSGYSADMEKMGYDFDLAKAKSLLKDAGWTPGADGVLVKDGKPLKLTMETLTTDEAIKVAQILQEQWKALGVQIDIEQLDMATLIGKAISGDFKATVLGYGLADADILALVFGSQNIQGMNLAGASDDRLDQLLLATRTTMDAAKRQAAVSEVAKYIMDKAYCLPLYVPQGFAAVSGRVKGLNFSPVTLDFWYNDTYIQK